MNATRRTNAFKTGNSVAVRLPKEFGIRAGEGLELVRRGGIIEIRPAVDAEHERARLKALADALAAIGPISGNREDGRIEFPDRAERY